MHKHPGVYTEHIPLGGLEIEAARFSVEHGGDVVDVGL